MISVDEALEFVRRHARALTPRTFAYNKLLGLRLAEPVASPMDSPPFNKSMVDGYAVNLQDDSSSLRVIETVTAGDVPQETVRRGATIQVMTGAPIPVGAQAMVKWEDCRQLDDQTIANPRDGISTGYCILPRGSSYRAGDLLLEPGKQLSALDVALLAEIGQSNVSATPRPQVAVLATGDELRAVDEAIGPGQIRNSNGPMLMAAVQSAGGDAVDLGVGRDDEDDLREKISRGLECDLLLVSGGVSVGVKDFVPSILAELGAAEVFHKVRMKPGKPLWFGLREAPNRRTLVFGLPGNPVSTYVSFRLFVAAAMNVMAGGKFSDHQPQRRRLTEAVRHRGDRPSYHPCRAAAIDRTSTSLLGVAPLPWRGSADIATLTGADCLAVLPAGDYELPADSEVDVLPL